MWHRNRFRDAAITAVALLMAPMAAYATNGYFSPGYSPAQDALGGAGTAMVPDASVVTINPAGAVWTGDQVDFSISVFSPRRYYGATPGSSSLNNYGVVTLGATNGNQRSDNEFFLIPGFVLNYKLDSDTAIGVAMFGNGGMNTKFANTPPAIFAQGLSLTGLASVQESCQGTFGGGQPVSGGAHPIEFCGRSQSQTGVDLIQLFLTPYYSRKIGHGFSVGIEPIFAAQRFRAYGLQAFAPFSNAPNNVSSDGNNYSYGIGGRVGFLWDIVHGVGIGASYQSRIYMTKFKKYSGLFAGGGKFDIPSSFNIGLQLHPMPNHRFVIDYQRINYHEVASVGNNFDPNAFVNQCAIPRLMFKVSGGLAGSNAPNAACLGSSSGPGFGWRDMIIYKFGYQYQMGTMKFRVGYSFSPHQPIQNTQLLFNVLAPGVITRHVTGGFSWRFSQDLSIDGAFMYAFGHTVVGKNPISSGLSVNPTSPSLLTYKASYGPNDQTLSINMRQFQATIGFNYRFGF